MVKYVVAGLVGDNRDAVLAGVREFPTQQFFFITPKEKARSTIRTKDELSDFKIQTDVIRIRGDPWEETFRVVSRLSVEYPELLINAAAAKDPMLQCVATCAAFVNGIRAFGVSEKGEAMLLPVLKFSYYKLLTDKKMSILHALDNPDCCASLQQLSRKTGMSLPLISYHVNGNTRSTGLVGLGLAETRGRGRRVSIHLTPLGKMLVRGYVGTVEQERWL